MKNISNIKNMIGWTNKDLEVVRKDINHHGGAAYWICLCHSCGKEKSFRGQYLRENKPETCGCKKKQYIMPSYDLTGMKVGLLTVLHRDLTAKSGRGISPIWICQCECGNLCSRSSSQLKQNKNSSYYSCGCVNKDGYPTSILGQHFGKLIVIEEKIKKDKNNHWLDKCKCGCGNEIEVIRGCLLSGHTTSCGCIKSKGEEKIALILLNQKINFETQKVFSTCRFPDTKGIPKFDFYLPEYKIIIEFDGEQHYYGWRRDLENLKIIQCRDNYKNQWCLKNNISLYRIPYYDIDNITSLKDILKDKYLIKENI